MFLYKDSPDTTFRAIFAGIYNACNSHRKRYMHKQIITIVIFLILAGCSRNQPYKNRFYRISTVIDATIYMDNSPLGTFTNPKKIEKTFARMDSIFLEWEKRFSQNEGSEIYAINHRTSDTVTVSPELCNILDTALAFGDSTDGLFDITMEPLKSFWKPECEDCTEPTPDQPSTKEFLAKTLPHVNYKLIKLIKNERKVIFLDSLTTIDVGGIAKGFVLHRVQTLLDSEGYKSYIVSAGGDIIFRGKKPGNKPFVVGVQAPRSADTLLTSFPVDSRSVITSGDYERFRITPDGKRIHHLFNPKTGYSETANMSVTILMNDPLQGIIWCKALFPRQAKDAVAFAESKGFEALVVDSAGTEFRTKGFPDRNR